MGPTQPSERIAETTRLSEPTARSASRQTNGFGWNKGGGPRRSWVGIDRLNRKQEFAAALWDLAIFDQADST
jgi:hypothetical protein